MRWHLQHGGRGRLAHYRQRKQSTICVSHKMICAIANRTDECDIASRETSYDDRHSTDQDARRV
jgi:hypothetical protein